LSNWHKNESGYQAALALQKTNGKPIALFFHTDWCASCKQLTANVLGQRDISDFMQSYNAVKINPENSLAEQLLAKQYNVLGYPTFLIKRANTEQIVRIPVSSRTNPQQFVQWCDRATETTSRNL
jgi:thiol:disulfide interchange protein DsbD